MRTRTLLVTVALAAELLSGCATQLGQQYGTLGAITGAVIGGAADGVKGAIIGGAVGAAAGGIIGDQKQFERERRNRARHRGGAHWRP